MFTDKKVLILGFARSGYEIAKLLIEKENQVIVNDYKELNPKDKEKKEELEKLGVEFIFGGHPNDLLNDSFDYLIKSPGIAIDHPYVLKAKEYNIEVVNETEVAYRLLPKEKNITLIGITGTNGKTTTTTLIYEIIKASGKRVHLAGNIGYPLCSFLKGLEENDIIVDEISCQQLENVKEYHPHIAVLTNISEAHLEFMKTYEHYKEVKQRIFQNQTKEDIAITNMENEEALSLVKKIKATTKYFSSKNEINGSYIKNQAIYYYEEKIIDLKKIKLVGMHNYENIMAAILVAKELGIETEVIQRVLKEFSGVEHRLEFVKEIKKRKFYNDTEATNIKCTQIALSSFQNPIILFLGGYERGQDFNELENYIQNVKAIFAIGTCRKRVKDFGDKMNIPTYQYEYLKDAFPTAWAISEENDIILLSPASASWDQYKECEERGKEFKEYVEKLEDSE